MQGCHRLHGQSKIPASRRRHPPSPPWSTRSVFPPQPRWPRRSRSGSRCIPEAACRLPPDTPVRVPSDRPGGSPGHCRSRATGLPAPPAGPACPAGRFRPVCRDSALWQFPRTAGTGRSGRPVCFYRRSNAELPRSNPDTQCNTPYWRR